MDDNSCPQLDDDLVLRAWEDDESVQGEILVRCGGALERVIARQFARLSSVEVEDVVAEAIKRFWKWRHKFDGRRSVRACLYRIATRVAAELVSGRLNWQKARNLERPCDHFDFEAKNDDAEAKLDGIEQRQPKICEDLGRVIEKLPEIQQDVIWAYGLAGDCELDVAHLGRELGEKYKDGVPIPAGTIRQYKKRAKDTIFSNMRALGYDLERLGVRQ